MDKITTQEKHPTHHSPCHIVFYALQQKLCQEAIDMPKGSRAGELERVSVSPSPVHSYIWGSVRAEWRKQSWCSFSLKERI